MAKTRFRTLTDHSGLFWGMIAANAALLALGLGGRPLSWRSHGHIVTGMSNQIVWGLPHVFAVFLIVVGLRRAQCRLDLVGVQPARLQALRAPLAASSPSPCWPAASWCWCSISAGPSASSSRSRTTISARSSPGTSISIPASSRSSPTYLFSMMDRQGLPVGRRSARASRGLAFAWRLALTTGTGSIFGFLIAREAYDAAIMAPLFIAASFLYGLSFTVAVLITMTPRDARGADGRGDDRQVQRTPARSSPSACCSSPPSSI